MKQKKWTSKEKRWIVPEGIKGQVPKEELCGRNGVCQSQYYKWRDRPLKAGAMLAIKQIFTSFCNTKGNADTERFFRSLKEYIVLPRGFETYAELNESLTKWIKSYNEDFPHSAIGYQTPEQYERNHTFNHQLNSQNILQVLAWFNGVYFIVA